MGNAFTQSQKSYIQIDPTQFAKLIDVDQSNQFKIYQNYRGQYFQKYQIKNNHQKDFKTNYQYRILNRTKELVEVLYADEKKTAFSCTEEYDFQVVTERIKLRLKDLQHLSFENALTITRTSLRGFQKIFKHNGILLVTDQMIGINCQEQIKVWLNSNFALNYIQQMPISLKNLQKEPEHLQDILVNNIIDLINSKTAQTKQWRQLMNLKSSYKNLSFLNSLQICHKLTNKYHLKDINFVFDISDSLSSNAYNQFDNKHDNNIFGNDNHKGSFQDKKLNAAPFQKKNKENSLQNQQHYVMKKEKQFFFPQGATRLQNYQQINSQSSLRNLNQKFNSHQYHNDENIKNHIFSNNQYSANSLSKYGNGSLYNYSSNGLAFSHHIKPKIIQTPIIQKKQIVTNYNKSKSSNNINFNADVNQQINQHFIINPSYTNVNATRIGFKQPTQSHTQNNYNKSNNNKSSLGIQRFIAPQIYDSNFERSSSPINIFQQHQNVSRPQISYQLFNSSQKQITKSHHVLNQKENNQTRIPYHMMTSAPVNHQNSSQNYQINSNYHRGVNSVKSVNISGKPLIVKFGVTSKQKQISSISNVNPQYFPISITQYEQNKNFEISLINKNNSSNYQKNQININANNRNNENQKMMLASTYIKNQQQINQSEEQAQKQANVSSSNYNKQIQSNKYKDKNIDKDINKFINKDINKNKGIDEHQKLNSSNCMQNCLEQDIKINVNYAPSQVSSDQAINQLLQMTIQQDKINDQIKDNIIDSNLTETKKIQNRSVSNSNHNKHSQLGFRKETDQKGSISNNRQQQKQKLVQKQRQIQRQKQNEITKQYIPSNIISYKDLRKLLLTD